MSSNPNSSRDIYPGLDDELDAVYERNVAEGLAEPAKSVAPAELETVVEEQLRPQQSERQLAQEIYEWANPQLKSALENWRNRYDIGPPTTELLASGNPNFANTMQRLYEVHKVLVASNQKTPEGLGAAETMQLVLIPWRLFADNLRNANPASLWNTLAQLRELQGIDKADYVNDHLKKAVEENKPLYRDPKDSWNTVGSLTYLEEKLISDGDWGIMLMQASEQAGLEAFKGRSPDQLTNNGKGPFELPGNGFSNHFVALDAMGIFEWLALTLQEEPSTLSASDYSWLLANRLDVNGDWCVPYGYWDSGQVGSYLGIADRQRDDVRPRLAVM